MKYLGPFKVVHRIGEVAYKLLLPKGAKIYHAFHMSLLKKCHGDPSAATFPLPILKAKDGPLIQLVFLLQVGKFYDEVSSFLKFLSNGMVSAWTIAYGRTFFNYNSSTPF